MEDHDNVGQDAASHPAEVTPLPRELRPGSLALPEEAPGIVLSVRRHGTSGSVTLRGELDAYTSPRLDDLCKELHASGIQHVEMDLAGTTFMDSSGLRALLACHRRLTDEGGSMQVSAVSEPVLRLLAITGLDEHFGLTDDRPIGATVVATTRLEADP